MKSTVKKSLIAVGVAAAIGLGNTTANAGVLASSAFTVSDFLIWNIGDGTDPGFVATVLTAGDFQTFFATSNANVDVDNGAGLSDGNGFNGPLVSNTDLSSVCVGNCSSTPAENNFDVLTAPVSGNFSYSDQLLLNAPFVSGIETGATLQLRSDVSLTGTGEGSAASNQGLDASFIFSLENPVAFAFDFFANLQLRAFTDVGTMFPGNAQASSSLHITITDLQNNTIYDFNNAGVETGCDLDVTRNRNAPFNGLTSYSCVDNFYDATAVLAAATPYQLSIRQDTAADALFIPEPGTLALLGAGLFGLGMARRRRSQK